MNYTCDRCGYTPSLLYDLKRHFNRKKICKPIYNDIEIPDLYNKYFCNEINKNHICEYCNKGYTSMQGKSNHKKICKIADSKKFEEVSQELVELKKKIEDLESNKMTNIQPHKTTIQNQNNIQNIQQQTNNNIQINVFGKEDMKYLMQDPNYVSKILNCIQNQSTGLCDLLTEKYFNVDHPENHTIKKPNKKDKFIDCYDGKNYSPKLPEDVITYILIKMEAEIGYFLENMYDENKKLNISLWRAFMVKVGIPLNWSLSYGDLNLDDNINVDDKLKETIKKDIYRLLIEYIYRKSKEWEEIELHKKEASANSDVTSDEHSTSELHV